MNVTPICLPAILVSRIAPAVRIRLRPGQCQVTVQVSGECKHAAGHTCADPLLLALQAASLRLPLVLTVNSHAGAVATGGRLVGRRHH